MSKRQHPSARELRHDTQGQLYGKEARESDGMLALRRAQHIEASRLFFKGRMQKRLITGKNRSGRLTEHIQALIEDVSRKMFVAIPPPADWTPRYVPAEESII